MFFNSFSLIDMDYFELLKPNEVSQSINPYFKANFYFILGIPRWFFDGPPKISKCRKGKLTLKLISDDNDRVKFPITIMNLETKPLDIRKVTLFKDSRFLTINDKITYQSIDVMLNNPNFYPGFKILYIGQAQGKKQTRTANDRLANHETFQKIIADVNQGLLNYEIRVLTFSIKETKIATILGNNIFQDNFSYEEIDRIIKDKEQLDYCSEKIQKEVAQFPSSESQINIVEAKLINYFKPQYNIKFKKDNIPNKSHLSYRDYFAQHFNSMAINLSKFVIDSSFADCTFYTDSRTFSPQYEQIDYQIDGNENTIDTILSYLKNIK
ncbi:type I restriction endonuclease subunit S [Streptococcus intermedius]|uniref:type I restriction endonuclease subunit S n=1 Tax=Streptococcus intermedius TaxID=1338 RepID=UPI000C82D623|nr:type I restriction endonuclease subunit S [Streptococcus intermedius]PMR65265.1 type I restriction endonuclease subunit S [Streptococcus intermedius]